MAGSINLECDKTELAKETAHCLLSDISDSEIISEYRKRLFILGENLIFTKNGEIHSATAVDINQNCNLIVKHTDGSYETLSSGEISIKI
jgi:biotin-(acetyl-CoA carboxylase) ligase